MAHELYQIDGEYSMAYLLGDPPPWHGYGQQVPANSPLEVWAKASHLDYSIVESPITYFRPDNGQVSMIQGQRALLRGDDCSYLSTVSDKFHVDQPIEVLTFFKDLVESGGFTLSTAGSLFGGRKYWALAKINESARIMGQDKIDGYLLLVSACDGSLSRTGMFTTTRVVCNNTLSYAIGEGERGQAQRYIKMPHSMAFDKDRMKEELGLGKGAFGEFIAKVETIAKVKISLEDATRFFLELYAGGQDEVELEDETIDEVNQILQDAATGSQIKKAIENEADLEKVPVRTVISLMELFKNGKGQDLKSANSTLWGAVNAVSEYYDHHQGNRSLDHRINSAFFGIGATVKNRAFEMAYAKAA